jgi:hypothetical protein
MGGGWLGSGAHRRGGGGGDARLQHRRGGGSPVIEFGQWVTRGKGQSGAHSFEGGSGAERISSCGAAAAAIVSP